MSPRLKNQSETENESSASRSRLRMLSGRRRSARPTRKSEAETEPDAGAVDLPAAEGAVVAARHLPGDLRPRPGLGDRAALVVDLARGDLAGRTRPDLDRPVARLEGRVGPAHGVRVVAKPAGNLAVVEEDLRHLRLGQALRRRVRAGPSSLREPGPYVPRAPSPPRRARRRRPRRGRGPSGAQPNAREGYLAFLTCRRARGGPQAPGGRPAVAPPIRGASGKTRACCR